jgi:hypothetical protein
MAYGLMHNQQDCTHAPLQLQLQLPLSLSLSLTLQAQSLSRMTGGFMIA